MHSRHRPTLVGSFAVALAFASPAFGQTTAPAVPTITPAPICEKPGDPPSTGSSELGKAAADTKRSGWTRSMRAYLECLAIFVRDHQAEAAPHIRAANAAIEEHQKATKVYNDYIEAAKQ